MPTLDGYLEQMTEQLRAWEAQDVAREAEMWLCREEAKMAYRAQAEDLEARHSVKADPIGVAVQAVITSGQDAEDEVWSVIKTEFAEAMKPLSLLQIKAVASARHAP